MHKKSLLKKQLQKQTRINPYEKAFDTQQSQQMIKNALDQMKQQGYDFQYSSKENLPKKHKEMLRRVYLRFNCDHCSRLSGKTQRWTSTRGTVGIQFQFRKQKDPNFFPDLLIFRLRIYGMKCKACNNYGEPEIYDSQLEKVENYFCDIVGNILKGIKPKRKRRNKGKPEPDLENHLSDLCQACKLGKCSVGDIRRIEISEEEIQD